MMMIMMIMMMLNDDDDVKVSTTANIWMSTTANGRYVDDNDDADDGLQHLTGFLHVDHKKSLRPTSDGGVLGSRHARAPYCDKDMNPCRFLPQFAPEILLLSLQLPQCNTFLLVSGQIYFFVVANKYNHKLT